MANPISQRWNHVNAVFARSINHLIRGRDCQPAVTRRKTNVKFDFHEYLYNPVNPVGSPNRITVCSLICTYVYTLYIISCNIIRVCKIIKLKFLNISVTSISSSLHICVYDVIKRKKKT